MPALGTIPFYNNAEHDLVSALKHGKMEEEAPVFTTPARIPSIQPDQDSGQPVSSPDAVCHSLYRRNLLVTVAK